MLIKLRIRITNSGLVMRMLEGTVLNGSLFIEILG